eukprot:6726126-Pyramimonas_sp.AAC.1
MLRHPAAFLLPAVEGHDLFDPYAGTVEDEEGVDSLSSGGGVSPPLVAAAVSLEAEGVPDESGAVLPHG